VEKNFSKIRFTKIAAMLLSSMLMLGLIAPLSITAIDSFSEAEYNIYEANDAYLIRSPNEYGDDFIFGLGRELTQECIDFILSYNGIPLEQAYIASGGDWCESTGLAVFLPENVTGMLEPLESFVDAHGNHYELQPDGRYARVIDPSAPPYEANCTGRQFERLLELAEGTFIVPFTLDGEPINVPSINLIMPPSEFRDYFIIGLDDEETQECIDFILSYTGIPRERAHIEQGWFEPTGLAVFLPENVTRMFEPLESFVDAHGNHYELQPDGRYARVIEPSAPHYEENYQEFNDAYVQLRPSRFETICTGRQKERLLELIEGNYYIVGLVDEETQECIDFILSYNGIPLEQAYVASGGDWCESTGLAYFPAENATFMFEPLESFVDAHGNHYELQADGRYARVVAPLTSQYEEDYQEIMPLGTWGIGSLIVVPDPWGINLHISTIGHPTCVNGTDFLTALHGNHTFLRGQPVFIVHYANWNTGGLQIGPQIGVVDQRLTFYEPARDAARINMIGSHRIMPFVGPFPGTAIMITDFGRGPSSAQARQGDPVFSLGGRTGTQTARIYDLWWNLFNSPRPAIA